VKLEINRIDLRAPKGPFPVWPDLAWIAAITESPLGPPLGITLRDDREDGWSLDFDFPAFTMVFSISPNRRRTVHIAERAYPYCWSPLDVSALLADIASGLGTCEWEAIKASLVPPEQRP